MGPPRFYWELSSWSLRSAACGLHALMGQWRREEGWGGARACPLSLGLLCPAAAPSPPHAHDGTAAALPLSPRPGLVEAGPPASDPGL